MSKPEFLTNDRDAAGAVRHSVADDLNAMLAGLQSLKEPPRIDIATAYFNVGGFELLAGQLEQAGGTHLLLGVEPPAIDGARRVLPPSRDRGLSSVRLVYAVQSQDQELFRDRDLLGFTVEADAKARRLIAWLETDGVEVRQYKKGFLHGKAFIVESGDHAVIAGSANFTYAGLHENLELALGLYQPNVVQQAVKWFGEIWEQAEPYDLAGVYKERFEPFSPWLIYLRMLDALYREEILAEDKVEDMRRVNLSTFQQHGVERARRILAQWHGVLIADEVGLGKTWIAGALIEDAIRRRQRALVIAPATLRDGPWRHFLADHQFGVECVSFEDLLHDPQLVEDRETMGERSLRFNINEYQLIVIDEAHAFRNVSTLRADALRVLLAGEGERKKDLVLTTATPVNNSLWDLYSLFSYFIDQDAAFARIGIPSIRRHFAEAMALDPEDLTPDHLFDVLDATSVRRTRPFIKKHYRDATYRDAKGIERPIVFPESHVVAVEYSLDEAYPDLIERVAAGLRIAADDDEAPARAPAWPALTLARYRPSQFRIDVMNMDADQARASQSEQQISYLLASGLLKRFESSGAAFAKTCRTMARSHNDFLSLLDQGWVATGTALREWVKSDSDDVEAFFTELAQRDAAGDLRYPPEPASAFKVDLLKSAVEADRSLLLEFAEAAETITPVTDPKLAALIDELVIIAAQAEAEGVTPEQQRDKRKVLVFSYFADTVTWIHDYLKTVVATDPRLAAYRGRLTSISGAGGSKSDVLMGFAPKTTMSPTGDDRYDLVVATDVLSEGVNLQQARHIINYDLPWNPMRLVQRHGRIDRIGSEHDRIYLRCILPDDRLDDLLDLEERLHRKIAQAAKSIGVGAEILPGSVVSEQVFTETREEIERLKREDASLFEHGTSNVGAFSGEEFRQILRKSRTNETFSSRLNNLVWGAGSGFVAQQGRPSGYVFCALVNAPITPATRPMFRFVPADAQEVDAVVSDTLTCLSHAYPPKEEQTERVLPDEFREAAFDAWKLARASIHSDWMAATDPAKLAAAVPKPMRDASAVLRDVTPTGKARDETDRLIDCLQAPYTKRLQDDLRLLVHNPNAEGQAIADAIAGFIADQNLQPVVPPTPLQVIDEEDIDLLAWIGIVPAGTVPTEG